jgi:hypothetical protein
MPRTRHAFDPAAERLEAHVLLSAASAALPVEGPPISETLSTNKTVYKVGQPIVITLTETNTTKSPVALANIAPVDGFTASRDFKIVWSQKAHNRERARSSTLQAGETRTIRAVWNGRQNVGSSSSGPLTGTFEIDSTLANNSVNIAIDPAHGKGSTAGVTSSVPKDTLTLTQG